MNCSGEIEQESVCSKQLQRNKRNDERKKKKKKQTLGEAKIVDIFHVENKTNKQKWTTDEKYNHNK